MQDLRQRWGERANTRFFVFFQAQALFVVFFSLPFAVIALDTDSGFGPLVWIGIARLGDRERRHDRLRPPARALAL